MLKDADIADVVQMGSGRPSGPQLRKTEMAQRALDEFLACGLDAAEVDWREIDDDYDEAKGALSYRISHMKDAMVAGASDIGLRSKRSDMKVYLVHTDALGQ